MNDQQSKNIRAFSFANVSSRVINFTGAVILLIPAALFVGIYYVIRLLAGNAFRPSYFYTQARLGRDASPFTMYKIRTLKAGSCEGGRRGLIPSGSGRDLPFGKFLREYRLDDAPQVWNMLRGNMNLFGPRPLRPEVYDQYRQEHKECDFHFRVKPGLAGYAQFLTSPHTPLRIQRAIDNFYINDGARPGGDLFLVGWMLRVFFLKLMTGYHRAVMSLWRKATKRGRGFEERQMVRYRSAQIWIQLSDVEFSDRNQDPVSIYDINSHAVSFISSRHFKEGETFYFYLIGCKDRRSSVQKKARCCGYVFKTYPVPNRTNAEVRCVLFYEPISPRHRYLIDHYVLHDTAA